MKFGVNLRREKTGAEVSVVIFQIMSLLPALYIFVLSGYYLLMTKPSVLKTLFDLGLSALPRAEGMVLSLLYRRASSEMVAFFTLMGFALAFGLLAERMLKGDYRRAKTSRVVFAALIAVDLIVRLLPLRCNLAFGWPIAIIAFAIRLGCLALILLDLRADRKQSAL